MKQKDLMAAIMSGKIVCVGEYWSGKCETITGRNKKDANGATRTFHVARETILTDTDPITITRFLKDEEKPENWKPAANKRDKVFVHVQGMEMMNGLQLLRGTVERIEADSPRVGG